MKIKIQKKIVKYDFSLELGYLQVCFTCLIGNQLDFIPKMGIRYLFWLKKKDESIQNNLLDFFTHVFMWLWSCFDMKVSFNNVTVLS